MTDDELRKLCEAATEGPWRVTCLTDGAFMIEGQDGNVVLCQRTRWLNRRDESVANGRLMCAARTEIPRLLAEKERLEAENARLRADNEKAVILLATLAQETADD